MTTPTATVSEPAKSHSDEATPSGWKRLDHWLEAASDYLNPILVKETRQALKSREFTFSFVLVLVACWIATFAGLAMLGPGVTYSASGGELFVAYFAILAFPLTIIVPFSTYRSMVAEREDNTYDLLSISTLGARQIVNGKLASAAVQTGVYLSAVVPCLAFTYMLRGIDLRSINLLLVQAVLGSMGLSMIALFMATLSKRRSAQVLSSVVLIIIFLYSFAGAIAWASEFITGRYDYFSNNDFVAFMWFLLIGFATTFAVIYFAAIGLLKAPSENRSTAVRVAMLVQQLAWLGIMAYFFLASRGGTEEILFVFSIISGVYWYLMGTLFTGEKPEVSHRVRRTLPQSFFGRAFLTWFNPGPHSGYFFVIANITAVGLISVTAALFAPILTPTISIIDIVSICYLVFLGWCYIVAYLGLGKLLLSFARKHSTSEMTLLASFLIQVLVLLAGSGIPVVIATMSRSFSRMTYSYLQLTNPFWTIPHVVEQQPGDAPLLAILVFAAAICVLLLNIRAIIADMRVVRVALPTRVVEDELILNPPPETQNSSPWD